MKPQKGTKEEVPSAGGRELVCVNTWKSKSVVSRSWFIWQEPPVQLLYSDTTEG